MFGFSKNSTTNSKLATMVGLSIVFFSLYGLYCYNTVREVKINGAYYQRIVEGKDVIADILPPPEYLLETYLTAFQLLDNKDPKDLPLLIEKIKQLKSDYLDRHEYWQAHLSEGGLKQTLLGDSYAPAMRMLDAVEKEFIPALQAGDHAKAEALLHGTLRREYDSHRAWIDSVVIIATHRNEEDESQAAALVHNRTVGQIGLGFFLVALLSAISWFLVRQIESSVAKVVKGVLTSSEEIGRTAQQLEASGKSLAEGASRQASSLEEISASLEELTSMTQQNAESARSASDLAMSSRKAAEKSHQSMQGMSQVIGKINSSSEESARIVKTIDEIAFQTNLLSLNAAVEAARAGEAGKGFAVVAEEVRSLARRSAEAAKNTTSLIDESRKYAKGGVAASSEAVGHVQGIFGNVEKLNGLVNEVAAACKEQAQGIDQINRAVSELDSVTQGNAAHAEQTAGAIVELSEQARRLETLVASVTNHRNGN